jgi:GWxTD domain-containing protein
MKRLATPPLSLAFGPVRAAALAVAGLLTLAVAVPAQTTMELFQKAKTQVKSASYEDALKTLAALDTETAKPGHEAERKQVEPVLAFYRGVCEAALGHAAEAKNQFVVYLGTSPNATIDAAIYPKKAVAAFEEARKEIGGGGGTPVASITASYASFRQTSAPAPEPPNEEWVNGPVRALLTNDEKRDYSRLADPVGRSEFITKFWASRDPKPETPENEFKQEFERRVAYADANLGQDEVRGSMTDRGTVFVLLGPPTYVGRKPLRSGEDTSDPSGMSTGTRHDAEVGIINSQAASPSGKSSSGSNAAIMDRANSPSNQAPETSANWREVWHYRREVLPAGVPYQQVDFDFITRKGYGKNVMQRDAATLNTLEAARRGKKV